MMHITKSLLTFSEAALQGDSACIPKTNIYIDPMS
jgi:hypothetical protein